MGIERRPRPVAFVHLPKAAGTTLHGILMRQYPADRTLILDVQRPGYRETLDAITERQKATALCLRGHMPFGLHSITGREFACITVLRDPVRRFISKYRNLARRPERALEMGFPLERLGSLEDFITMQVERNAMNFQTRMIAGWVDLEAPLFPYAEPVPDEALARAQANIEQYFTVAGLVEKFDESVALMQLALGWSPVRYARRNVAPGAGSSPGPGGGVQDRLSERIRSLNHLDVQLVAFATARLEHQMQAAGEEFTRALAGIRRRSGMLSRLQGLARSMGLGRMAPLARRFR